MFRYSPICGDDELTPTDPKELANINNLEDYIELLYEEVVGQVHKNDLCIIYFFYLKYEYL
jgi:hypothetical protein